MVMEFGKGFLEILILENGKTQNQTDMECIHGRMVIKFHKN